MAVGAGGGVATGIVARTLRALAATTPAPFFAASDAAREALVEDLALDARLRRVRSPRHASVLLVAGAIPPRAHRALRHLHDQLPHPRATLRWGATSPRALPRGVRTIDGDLADAAASVARLHRELVRGEYASDTFLCPDEPPAPWRDRGEHGQGGEGMMGGRPYGRPMAMTGPDLRDGLALDRLPVRIGPFHPGLPPGLVLALTLQGDVVQEAACEAPPFPAPVPAVLCRAREEAVPQGEIERARAERSLRRVARLLRLLGMDALAERAQRAGSPGAVARLRALLRLGGAWRVLARTRDVGVRLSHRLDHAERSLARAARADAERSWNRIGADEPDDPEAVDAPLGTRDGALAEEIRRRLPGLEWGEALCVAADLGATAAARAGEVR